MKKNIVQWINEWRFEPQLSAADMPFSFAMGGGQKPSKPTVRVERRRPGSTGTPSSRPRADTPQRERPQTGGSTGGFSGGGSSGSGGFSSGSGGFSGGSSGSSGGSFGSSGTGGGGAGLITSLLSLLLSGGGTRGGKRKPSLLLIILLIALAACCILFILPNLGNLLDMGSLVPETVATEDLAQYNQPVVEEAPVAIPVLPTLAPSTAGGDTWLIMLYQDADDQILEKDIFVDLNEAERIGSTDNVKVVAQLDRFKGAFNGDGNWTSTKRFLITRDNDLTRISSQQVADLGEANMADGQTLVDFVTWAMSTYPSDKYVLILSDHGAGWPGGWSDPTASGSGERNLPLANAMGDQLYLMEIDEALGQIRSQTGLDKFEVLGMDACLMGHIEVLSAMAPHARYFVGSQETEPSLGWAYASMLSGLNANPGMNGGDLGKIIVNSYIQEDQRIVDDAARADFVGRGSVLGGMMSGPTAAQIAQQLTRDITLSVVDLAAVPQLVDSLNSLAYQMQGSDQRAIAQARNYAQSFTSIFGTSVPASYIDLGNFSALLSKASSDGDVDTAASQLQAVIDLAVVAERHGSNKPGATGISVYFPNSKLYQTAEAGPQSYTVAAVRFATETLWDDFLAFHYTGKQFEMKDATAVVPSAAAVAPAAGGIQVSNLRVSDTEAAPGSPILLSVDIKGANLGYVKLLAGYIDTTARSIYVADMDYLQSPETREANGVFYPAWDSTEFTMEFEWEPIVYAISDGSTLAEAVFNPQSYGASAEEAVYTVDGLYTFAESGEQRYARAYFRDGILQSVYGFTGTTPTGSPREITTSINDTFTVYQKWMDLDSNGSVKEVVLQAGETLTFGDQPFTWEVLNAAPGSYIVGFIIEDLDGNQTPVYQQVTVK